MDFHRKRQDVWDRCEVNPGQSVAELWWRWVKYSSGGRFDFGDWRSFVFLRHPTIETINPIFFLEECHVGE